MDINSKWLLSLTESLLTWNEQGKFHVVLQIHEFRSKFVCAKSIDAKVYGCTKNLTKLKKKQLSECGCPKSFNKPFQTTQKVKL